MSEYTTFTSESVSEGHPDKLSDQISDAILDAFLAEDPKARVACETLVKTDLVVVAGEITSSANPDLERVVRNVINEIGYDNDDVGFNGDKVEFLKTRNRNYVYFTEKYKIKCERKFEVNPKNIVVGFSSKNCF